MTLAPPPSVLPIRSSGSNRTYQNSNGSIGGTIGKVPAGTLIVVANFLGPVGGGVTTGSVVLGAQGGNLAMGMTEVHAGDPAGSTNGFQLAWAYVPASYANDATLAYGVAFGHGASNVVVDTQWIALDGADPSIPCVGGYLDSISGATGWSTPAVQAPFDGVELHVFCVHNEGSQSATGFFSAAPFGTLEADSNIPFVLSAGSVWAPHAAGPTKPQAQNISGVPTYNVPGVSVPTIQSAVLVMPLKRRDVVGELVT